MKIDLHIHSKNGSDGRWDISDIFAEASRRGIGLVSITDHDSMAAQEQASSLARFHSMRYVTGIELNITFSHPGFQGAGGVLDMLGYGYDIHNKALSEKLEALRAHRVTRAERILEKLNAEFRSQGMPEFTAEDMEAIQARPRGPAAHRLVSHRKGHRER